MEWTSRTSRAKRSHTTKVARSLRLLAAAAPVLMAVALSACSSSSAVKSGDASSANGSAPSAAAKAKVAQAQAFVKAHSADPASVGTTTPLTKKPPAGKTVVFVAPPVSSSQDIENGMKAAASVLGWKIDLITESGDPTAVAAAMSLAVEKHPTAIVQAGQSLTAFSSQVAAANREGIAYIAIGTEDPLSEVGPGKAITALLSSNVDFQTRGAWLAQWVVADSDGSADIVDYNLSDYPAMGAVVSGFSSTIAAMCPDCTLDNQDATSTSIGTSLPGQIVSYLTSHPKVKYVAVAYSDMTIGLAQALKTAGLTDIKVVVQGPSSRNFQNIVDGTESVAVGASNVMTGWLAIDAVARFVVGDPVDESYYSVLADKIVTKANVSDPSQPYVVVPDYVAQFEKLWHVS
jgi:ABC-type sugar transport system substrate-binding protein